MLAELVRPKNVFSRIRAAACASAAVLAAVCAPEIVMARGYDYIAEFQGRVEVGADGALTVTETISVVSAGGIGARDVYRGIPTIFPTGYGAFSTFGLEVVDVRWNSESAPFSVERYPWTKRIYPIGSDKPLRAGRHEFVVIYRTDRHIEFLQGFDELTWRVGDLDWSLPVARTSVDFVLPAGVNLRDWKAHTGPQDRPEQDYTWTEKTGVALALETDRITGAGGALTVTLAWPSGSVVRPSAPEIAIQWMLDNAGAVAGMVWFFLLLGYFLVYWRKVGRDPVRSVITPKCGPPAGISPAAARYVKHKEIDGKILAAALVNLAVKGVMIIKEREQGGYIFEKNDVRVKLSPGERALVRVLFKKVKKRVMLDQWPSARFKKAEAALKEALKAEFAKAYFLANTGYFLAGAGIALVGTSIVAALAANIAQAFVAMWLIASAGYAMHLFWRKLAVLWRRPRAGSRFLAGARIAGLSLFLMLIVGGGALQIWLLAEAVSPLGAAPLLAMLVLCFLFYRLLKARTLLGRKVVDEIESFEKYLSIVGEDPREPADRPERTVRLFERFVPYAVALDVECDWSERFAGVPYGGTGSSYQPAWYVARNRFDSPRAFALSLRDRFSVFVAGLSSQTS